MKKISLKRVLLTLVLLIVVNAAQISILHAIRVSGDINFYRWDHHIAVLIYSITSILSTMISWKICNVSNSSRMVLDTIKAFILACFLFQIIVMFLDWIFVYLLSDMEYVLLDRFMNTGMLLVIIHIYISSFTLAFLYFNQTRKRTIDLEKMDKEKAQLQAQILQKNLEPHFLFNNLSVISNLARKNPEKIDDFIDDLSEVYRYYLQNGKEPAVELDQELKFLKQYIRLIKARFGRSYELSVKVDNVNGFIVPCSLQLCVENAIKHNRGNEDEPLQIQIIRDADHIKVINTLNRVDTVGTGTGNEFLIKKYKMIFERNVVFREESDLYIAEIPIINANITST